MCIFSFPCIQVNNKLPLCLDSLWKSSLSPLSRSSSSSSSSSDDLWARRDVEKRTDSGLSGLGEASYRPTPLTSSLCAYSFSFGDALMPDIKRSYSSGYLDKLTKYVFLHSLVICVVKNEILSL